MPNENLVTIPVSQLKPGMLIHQIGKQSGKLVVKHRGRLFQHSVIEQLIQKGVETVVVEKQAIKKESTLSRLLHGTPNKHNAAQSTPNLLAEQDNAFTLFSTDQAYVDAAKLLDDLKLSFKSIASRVRKDLTIPTEYLAGTINNVHSALLENKDALLFMLLYKQNDDFLYAHAVRCSVLMCLFAQSLELSEEDCKRLATVGFLFDIGMLSIPPSIRKRKVGATLEEQLVLQTHVLESLSMLEYVTLDNEQLLSIEQHHERLDGSGYPYGIQGENIHVFARMLAIVDYFDAMTAAREYHNPITPAAALKSLCYASKGYDRKLAVQFLRAIGIYPRGSGVALTNGDIAVVTKVMPDEPLKPMVQSVYSLNSMKQISPRHIDLTDNHSKLAIKKPVLLSQFGINDIMHVH